MDPNTITLPPIAPTGSPAPTAPTQPTMDMGVVNLAKAIRQRESGGKYDAIGDNGTSAGAFQWSNNGVALKPGEAPANFKAAAQKFLGDANADFNEANQKAVAYAQIKEYKDQGLTPAQIAAKWNSGSADGWENKKGTTTINGKTISYDVPAYVKAVTDYYQKYKAESGGDTSTPDTSAPSAPTAFKFPVAPSAQDQQSKIANLQSEADQSKVEADKANSFGGMVSNFGKAFVSNIAGSEVGLGTTIGQTLATDDVTKNLTDANQRTADTKVALLQRIRENKAAGKDTTKLEQTYNSVYGGADNTPSVTDILPSLKKTTGNVLGELGGTALDVLAAGTYGKATAGMKAGEMAGKEVGAMGAAKLANPEFGKVAEIASKPSGAFSLKGATNIAKGAGVGYAQDVTQGLQGNRGENRTGSAAFIPGMGTAIGTAIPLASELTQTGKNVFNADTKANNIIDQRKKELGVLDDYASVSKRVQKAKDKGIDVKDIVANTDLLHGAVDKNGVINTKGEGNAIDQLNQFIKPQEDVISKNLKNEGVSLPASTVQKKLEYEVNQSGLKGGAKIRALNEVAQDMEGYKLDANKDGTIPLSVIHDAKVDKYSNINFMTDAEKQKSAKAIARGLKQLVEDNTKSVDVKALNKELSQHYAVMDYLDSLDGKRVEGGRLGKYFAKTVGAIVGGHFGPLGAIAGAETAGAIKGNSMARTFGGKIGKNLEQSQAMKNAVASGNAFRLKVNSLPSDYTNELPTIPFGNPAKVPKSNLPVIR